MHQIEGLCSLAGQRCIFFHEQVLFAVLQINIVIMSGSVNNIEDPLFDDIGFKIKTATAAGLFPADPRRDRIGGTHRFPLDDGSG